MLQVYVIAISQNLNFEHIAILWESEMKYSRFRIQIFQNSQKFRIQRVKIMKTVHIIFD